MTAVAEPTLNVNELTCEVLASYQDDLSRLSKKRGDIKYAARLPMEALRRILVESGQKSKKIGEFTIYLKHDERHYCECHGAAEGYCDTPTGFVVHRTPRVFVRRNGQEQDGNDE